MRKDSSLHYCPFRTTPRLLGEQMEALETGKCIELMEMARLQSEKKQAYSFIRNALNPSHRQFLNLRTIFLLDKGSGLTARLYGIIADIDMPRITISHEKKIFPMRQARFRPFFETISLSPEINPNSDIEDAGLLEKPVTGQKLQTCKRTSHRQLSSATSP